MSALTETKDTLRTMNNASLCWLYTVTKYHERYKFLSLLQTELLVRGFENADLDLIDSSQSVLYEKILNGQIA